ncbi:MAG TPA: DnaB-like helicase C-terminal domain-containing protein [Pirellulales bacterium]|nr:DnaB-like helicase C-terminal domain-containing protein [Pirellulales bacterium]
MNGDIREMDFDKVPAELKNRRQWVVWKVITRRDSSTKVPFQAASGAPAKSNDPATWGTFAEAAARFAEGGFAGIGFVFGAEDEFCGVDLDGCRDPASGELAAWAREVVTRLNSYSEVSPSQTGVKVFLRGRSPWSAGKKIPVTTEEAVCDREPAIEVYHESRYFAVTGQRLGAVSPRVESRQQELDWLAKTYTPAETPASRTDWRSDEAVCERARKYLARMPVSISGSGGHNAAFNVACRLVIDFALTEAQALGLMSEWNLGCQPPWSEKELRHKVGDAAKQPGDRGRLRNAKEEKWQQIELRDYRLPRRDGPLANVRRTTLEAATFARIEQIESHSDSLLSLSLPDLDAAIGGGVEPGEMVIVAARPNHGKSAVGLQMVHHLTSLGHPAIIVSEEMSALALGKRALQFASEVPKEHWRCSVPRLRQDALDHFSSRAPCYVVESCKSVYRAADEIRAAVKDHEARLAVVDYAQLLLGRGQGRYEQITETSTVLRQVATETQVVLVALCQMSRAIEGRKSFIPLLSDLKDSGQLEQDADVILFLCWPHRLDPQRDASEFQFYIAKNRNREINTSAFVCVFEPSRQRLITRPTSLSDAVHYGPAGGEPWDVHAHTYPGAL